MKNIFKYISVLVCGWLFASCSAELSRMDSPDRQQDGSEEAVCGVPMTFTASFATTKTAITGEEGSTRKVEWVTGDQIRIFYKDADGVIGSRIAAADSDGAVASFPVTLPECDTYYAVYPASAASNSSLDKNGQLTVNVNGEDAAGTFAEASISAARTDAEKKFTFKNAASIVKFELTEATLGATIASCNQCPVSGDMIVTIDGNGLLSAKAGANVSDRIDTDPLAAGVHYFAVIPGNYANGIAVRTDAEVPAFFDEASIEFPISTIVNFGKVQEKAIKDYYITENGSGDGRSWETAGNAETVVKALHRSAAVLDNAVVELMSWKANGATFHFGAGEYFFNNGTDANGIDIDYYREVDVLGKMTPYTDSRVSIKMLGGYPAEGGEVRDPSENRSIFTGRGTNRLFQIRELVDIQFDGLTFAKAYAKTYTGSASADYTGGNDFSGSAIYISDRSNVNAVETISRPHVDITNCIFTENYNAATDGTRGGRTCISLAKGQCHVMNSKFLNNRTYGHGIVGGSGGAGPVEKIARGELFFNACLFEGNTCDGNPNGQSWGNVSYCNSKGTYKGFYNCTFRNNQSNEEAGHHDYAVIYWSRTGMIANCTFVEKMNYNENNNFDDTKVDKAAVVRFQGDVLGCLDHTMCNNVIIDEGKNEEKISVLLRNSSSGIYTGNGAPYRYARLNLTNKNADDWTAQVSSSCGNILTRYKNLYATDPYGVTYGKEECLTLRDVQDTTYTAESLGLVWDETRSVYTWSGMPTAKYVPVNQDAVVSCLTSNPDVGDIFYRWLLDENILDKDALGNIRGEKWTPGAYQAY